MDWLLRSSQLNIIMWLTRYAIKPAVFICCPYYSNYLDSYLNKGSHWFQKKKKPKSYCNKKLLQNKLSSVSGKAVLLKDLSNLKTNANYEKTRNNLEATVKTLIKKHSMCDAWSLNFYTCICLYR